MPVIYYAGQTIPELGGAVKGGISIVVPKPEDVAGLPAICEMAGRP